MDLMVLSQLSADLGAPHICDPTYRLMHQISEGFVRQPRDVPSVS